MNYTRILKRAWHITFHNKALWLFGFLFSLFSSGGGSSTGQGMRYTFDGGDRVLLLPGWAILLLLLSIGLLLLVLGVVLRYSSRGALIGMVREADQTGQTSASSGWRIGWSRFLPLFGIEWAIAIPAVVVMLLLLAIGLSPLVLLAAENRALTIVAIAATVLMMLLVIGLLTAMGLVLSIVGELAHRQCVLENKGVLESIRDGYRTGRQNLQHVGLIWVLLLVLSLAFGAVMVPIAAVVFGLAAAPAAAIYGATESIWSSLLLGVLLAIPGMLAFAFLNGIFEAFKSAVWTLAYEEMQL